MSVQHALRALDKEAHTQMAAQHTGLKVMQRGQEGPHRLGSIYWKSKYLSLILMRVRFQPSSQVERVVSYGERADA